MTQPPHDEGDPIAASLTPAHAAALAGAIRAFLAAAEAGAPPESPERRAALTGAHRQIWTLTLPASFGGALVNIPWWVEDLRVRAFRLYEAACGLEHPHAEEDAVALVRLAVRLAAGTDPLTDGPCRP